MDLAKAIKLMADKVPDPDLFRAYQRSAGEPGAPEADALVEEIERRGLDV